MVLSGPNVQLPGPATPHDGDDAILEAVAQRVVGMNLAAPAIFFLESTKPLSYVGSQALVFLEPFVKSLFNLANYDRFVALLEDRKNIERLMQRIESLDETTRDEAEREKQRKRQEERQSRDGVAGGKKWWQVFTKSRGTPTRSERA